MEDDSRRTPIAFITDFGTCDWFVGSMKGVAISVNPEAIVIDITHDIEPGSIGAAAYALMASCRCFPPTTVFVVVVDPGVGGNRRVLAAQAGNYWFVGPDNGVLWFALRQEAPYFMVSVDNEDYFHKPVSATFHGRDIFTPVAAHISRGVPIENMGTPCDNPVRLRWPEIESADNGALRGEIVYLDRFGNAFSNIAGAHLSAREYLVHVNDLSIPIRSYYAQAAHGAPLALINSAGYVEIAINGGDAARKLGLRGGTPVTVVPKK